MACSLSDLINNLGERIHIIKCEYGYDNEKCETCGIKYKNCECSLQYAKLKDNLIKYKISKKFHKTLKKRCFNTYTFSNHDINEFVLLLQEDMYPYRYMDD